MLPVQVDLDIVRPDLHELPSRLTMTEVVHAGLPARALKVRGNAAELRVDAV